MDFFLYYNGLRHERVKKFRFAHFLFIEGYREYYLRKESVIAPFERFKTATLRKCSN